MVKWRRMVKANNHISLFFTFYHRYDMFGIFFGRRNSVELNKSNHGFSLILKSSMFFSVKFGLFYVTYHSNLIFLEMPFSLCCCILLYMEVVINSLWYYFVIIKKYSINLCDKILNLRKQIITIPIYTTKCCRMEK